MQFEFDHYIAIDWALSNIAVARATKQKEEMTVFEGRADIYDIKTYLKSLRGKRILCVEESTPAQWLWTELRECVDEMIVCDPTRNHFLREGAKNDRIDAIKLVRLLKAGLLKPVFHSSEELIYLRKLVSGYEDMIRAGVRLKNQRSALLRSYGLDREAKLPDQASVEKFVIEGIDEGLGRYESERKRYEREFLRIEKKIAMVKLLRSVPGIGLIGAVKVASVVVDPKRFPTKSNWLSYCGLVKHEIVSGGRVYGKRSPRSNRVLKTVFKTAALSVIQEKYSLYRTQDERESAAFQRYYVDLINKGVPEHHARHNVSRRIAVIALGVMKSGKKFEDKWMKENQVQVQ